MAFYLPPGLSYLQPGPLYKALYLTWPLLSPTRPIIQSPLSHLASPISNQVHYTKPSISPSLFYLQPGPFHKALYLTWPLPSPTRSITQSPLSHLASSISNQARFTKPSISPGLFYLHSGPLYKALYLTWPLLSPTRPITQSPLSHLASSISQQDHYTKPSVSPGLYLPTGPLYKALYLTWPLLSPTRPVSQSPLSHLASSISQQDHYTKPPISPGLSYLQPGPLYKAPYLTWPLLSPTRSITQSPLSHLACFISQQDHYTKPSISLLASVHLSISHKAISHLASVHLSISHQTHYTKPSISHLASIHLSISHQTHYTKPSISHLASIHLSISHQTHYTISPSLFYLQSDPLYYISHLINQILFYPLLCLPIVLSAPSPAAVRDPPAPACSDS